MRRAVTIITAYLLLLLCAFLPAQKTAAPTPTLPTPQQAEAAMAKTVAQAAQAETAREVRALWVVRDTMTSPESVKEMVRRAKENGFTDLVVQVRGRGDAYYNSRVEPRA